MGGGVGRALLLKAAYAIAFAGFRVAIPAAALTVLAIGGIAVA